MIYIAVIVVAYLVPAVISWLLSRKFHKTIGDDPDMLDVVAVVLPAINISYGAAMFILMLIHLLTESRARHNFVKWFFRL